MNEILKLDIPFNITYSVIKYIVCSSQTLIYSRKFLHYDSKH